MFAKTPNPPYHAVIFTTHRSAGLATDVTYIALDKKINALAKTYSGFLGAESLGNDTQGITVTYWQDEQSIRDFKQESEHKAAQFLGREKFYQAFFVRVATVTRAYQFGVTDGD